MILIDFNVIQIILWILKDLVIRFNVFLKSAKYFGEDPFKIVVPKIRITFKTILWELWASYSGLSDQNNLPKVFIKLALESDTNFEERFLSMYHQKIRQIAYHWYNEINGWYRSSINTLIDFYQLADWNSNQQLINIYQPLIGSDVSTVDVFYQWYAIWQLFADSVSKNKIPYFFLQHDHCQVYPAIRLCLQ